MFRCDLVLKYYTIAPFQDDALFVDRKALLFNGFASWLFGIVETDISNYI